MIGYASFIKNMVINKRSLSFEDDKKFQHCSDIAITSLVPKKKLLVPLHSLRLLGYCIFCHFAKALCDLCTSVIACHLTFRRNQYWVIKKNMWLLMVDRNAKKPIGLLHDVLLTVESFIFLEYFVILNLKVDFAVPVILGRPFLSTGRGCLTWRKGIRC